MANAGKTEGGLHTKKAFDSMIKMDSFMKKSQRLSPPSLRKLLQSMQAVQLSAKTAI